MRKITLALSLLLALMIPWEGVIRIPGLGNGTKIMGFVLAASWLTTIAMTRRVRRPGLFQFAVLVFVLWNALSILWSANPYRSLSHIITWLQVFMLVYIWWDLYTTPGTVRAGLQAYILGAYVAVGAALVNAFAGRAFYAHFSRYSPGQTNPDGFGFILALGVPVATYLATSQSGWRMSNFWKFANYLYIPAGMLGIALSGTRTALIAAVVGTALGLILLTRLRPLPRIAIFLLFILATFILLDNVHALQSFQRFSTTATELTQGTLHDRIDIWREGLVSFAQHPFVGVGSNMFVTVNSLDKAAHNSFLSVLVELGLVGLLLFGFILAIAVAQAMSLPRWESWFWITLLTVWTIGASTLTWEDRKSTWLFLCLLVASAALSTEREKAASPAGHSMPELEPAAQV